MEAVFRLQADVVELHLGGQTITTTMEHPFYREGEGWVRVMDLQPGDRLVGRDGQAPRLDTITRTETRATVYNLRVATDHTYFVGDADWGFSLWVHNAYLVQSVADGTFQIVDDVGNVVRKGIPDQATASALATQLNTPAVLQLDDLAGAVPNGKLATHESFDPFAGTGRNKGFDQLIGWMRGRSGRNDSDGVHYPSRDTASGDYPSCCRALVERLQKRSCEWPRR